MFKSHRFLVPLACLAGVLSIVGVGFSAWIFVDDLKPQNINTEVGVNVAEKLDVGLLRLSAEDEARKEVYGDTKDPYDYTIGDAQSSEDQAKYSHFVELVRQYSHRKIVFSEGNPDSTSLEDGMTFFRFYYDPNLEAKTFRLEPYIEGSFLIESAILNDNHASFDIGVRVPYIKQNNPNEYRIPGDSSALVIDNFIQINPKYYSLLETNGFNFNGEQYISFKNVSIFNWTYDGEVDVIKKGAVNGEKTKFTKYTFKIDLNEMLIYEDTRKPNDRNTVKEIESAIADCKERYPEYFDTFWGIKFELASVLY